MTPNELSARLRIMQEALQNPALRDRMAVAACNQISALVKRRVFRDGIAQDGGKIGSYSTKPAYFSTSIPGLPKVAPKGKAKRAKKTYYSETGYKGFRDKVGRQSGKVDLNLTGGTFSNVGVGQSASGVIAFGIKDSKSAEIIAGNEKRFGVVTVTPNEEERKAAIEAAKAELKFALGF